MAKIVLDAGHGLYTAGKRCLASIDPNETREWVLNDRIVDKVQKMLADYDCTVIRTDDTTGATDVSLATRVNTANNNKADIMVSVHHNAGINGGAGGGTVVYCWDDDTSNASAKRLYDSIIAETGLVGNRSNHIGNGKNLYLVKNTNMTCLLIENGFMDSTEDTPIILTEDHAEKTAKGIVNFLVKEFALEKKAVKVETATPYYPKYTGWSVGLDSILKAIGVPSQYRSGWRSRIPLAKANGISNYEGTSTQNSLLKYLARNGLLKRV